MHLRLGLTLGMAVASVTALAAPAMAAGQQDCRYNNDLKRVVCRVVNPGGPGSGGGGGSGGGSGEPLPEPVLVGVGCVPAVVPVVPCRAVTPGRAGGVTVTAAQVGSMAASALRLPAPTARWSPDDRLPDGRATTYVQLQTWFYVPAQQWRVLRVSATAGGITATATARPVALELDPGDGTGVVSCVGPGRAWVFGVDKNFDVAPGGCSHAYRRSSYGSPDGMVTARYAIRWRVSWTATGGASGVLADVVTTSTVRYAVAEAQAVVVR